MEIARYVSAESLPYGRVSAEPAWFVAPHVSLWSVEDALRPGWPGAWVICGDLPTDFVQVTDSPNARDALRVLAHRWSEVAEWMARGEAHPEFNIGTSDDWPELAPLLRARAELLDACADDPDLWPDANPRLPDSSV